MQCLPPLWPFDAWKNPRPWHLRGRFCATWQCLPFVNASANWPRQIIRITTSPNLNTLMDFIDSMLHATIKGWPTSQYNGGYCWSVIRSLFRISARAPVHLSFCPWTFQPNAERVAYFKTSQNRMQAQASTSHFLFLRPLHTRHCMTSEVDIVPLSETRN
jgi:hypothetical protein